MRDERWKESRRVGKEKEADVGGTEVAKRMVIDAGNGMIAMERLK